MSLSFRYGRWTDRRAVRYSTTRDETRLRSGPGPAPVRVAGHCPGAAAAPRAAHAGPGRAARDLQGAGRDQHQRLGGRHHPAARAMAARLKAGGFADADLQIIVPPGAPKKGNLVARLTGTGAKKPLLLLAHLDVVEA